MKRSSGGWYRSLAFFSRAFMLGVDVDVDGYSVCEMDEMWKKGEGQIKRLKT
jgi:hypothetical protein